MRMDCAFVAELHGLPRNACFFRTRPDKAISVTATTRQGGRP